MTPTQVQEQRTALLEAMTSGVLTVEYADRKVQYRSMHEMRQALGLLDTLQKSRAGFRQGKIICSRGFD
jgi:hypothetical protein